MEATSSSTSSQQKDLSRLSVKQLKSLIASRGGSSEGLLEKSDLVLLASQLSLVDPAPSANSPSSSKSTIESSSASSDLAAVLTKGDPRELDRIAGLDDPTLVFEQGKGGPCGKVFSKGELAYHCKTCQHDDTCVLCKKCFDDSDHEGHDWFHCAFCPYARLISLALVRKLV